MLFTVSLKPPGNVSLSKSPKCEVIKVIRADNELFCEPLSPTSQVTNPNGIFSSRNKLLNGAKYVKANNGMVISFFVKSSIDKDVSMLSFISYFLFVN